MILANGLPTIVMEEGAMQRRTKILIREYDDTIRFMYDHILPKYADLQVVANVGTGREAICHAMEWDLDVFVTNIHTPDCDPFLTVREIARLCPSVKVLYSSGYEAPQVFAKALVTMANGYLIKPYRIGTFLEAIDTLAEGGHYFSEPVLDWLHRGRSSCWFPEWW
jgi:DNA-binding NarL/FixJ family response regulator